MFNLLGNFSEKTGEILHKHKVTRTLCFALWKASDTLFWQPIRVAKKAPFIRAQVDMKDFMGLVIGVLLLFSVLPSIYLFGLFTVLPKIIFSFICGVFIVDVGWVIVTGEEDINEGAFVTCLFIPLIFPPFAPLWIIGLASAIAILIRNIFGGVGKNIWNPALLARLIITLSFALFVSSGWEEPFWGIPTIDSVINDVDTVTSATPLFVFKDSGQITSHWQLLTGQTPGCLGETCRITLILGGLLLCWTGIANWRIPLSYLGSVAVLSAALHYGLNMERVAPPIFQLLSGGLLLGAFFMATDPVTAPYSHFGKWVFGIGCGSLTVLLRTFGPFPEAVMFSILTMNTLKTPLDWVILQLHLRIRKPRQTGKPRDNEKGVAQ